ncbi:hypothetical protein F5884DRAFT_244679 [Xylogone sp. PMI_703]|nr:hypothetical protein F5884DRAFT_244679 [Xylogone sp. PMI_703]
MTATSPVSILDLLFRFIGRNSKRRQNDAPTKLEIEIGRPPTDAPQRHLSAVRAEYQPESEHNKISLDFTSKLDLDGDTRSRISAGEQKKITLCWRRQGRGPDTSPNGGPYSYEMEFLIVSDLSVDVLLGRFKQPSGMDSCDPFHEPQEVGTSRWWLRKARKSLLWSSDKQNQRHEHGRSSCPPAQALQSPSLQVAAAESNNEQTSEGLRNWVKINPPICGDNNEENSGPARLDAEDEESRASEQLDDHDRSVSRGAGADNHGIVIGGSAESADIRNSAVINHVPPESAEPSIQHVLTISPRDSTDSQLSSFRSEDQAQSSTSLNTTVRPKLSNESLRFDQFSGAHYFTHHDTLNGGVGEGPVVLPQDLEPERSTPRPKDQQEIGSEITVSQKQDSYIHKRGYPDDPGGYKLIIKDSPRAPSKEREADEYWTWDPEKKRHYHLNPDQTRDYYYSDSDEQ